MEYVLLILPAMMISGGIWQRNNEKRDWNDGICKDTGMPWKSFDVDSQGGRGYKSINYNGGKTYWIWISYGVDK